MEERSVFYKTAQSWGSLPLVWQLYSTEMRSFCISPDYGIHGHNQLVNELTPKGGVKRQDTGNRS